MNNQQRAMTLPGGCMRTLLHLCIALWATLAASVHAQPVQLVEGVHYQQLAAPLADADAERIEVVELFTYGCPTCYDLLPTLQIWEASYRTSDLTFTRLPVVWSPVMATHARLYLVADTLGLVPAANKSSWEVMPTFHNTLFEAVQRNQQPLLNADEAADLFATAGVTRERFDTAWNAEAVNKNLAELQALPGPTAIPRLPALMVEGRYVITLNEAVKSTDDIFKVLSQLVVDLRESRRRAAQ